MEKLPSRTRVLPDEEAVIKGTAAVVFAAGADTVRILLPYLRELLLMKKN